MVALGSIVVIFCCGVSKHKDLQISGGELGVVVTSGLTRNVSGCASEVSDLLSSTAGRNASDGLWAG